MVQSISSTSTGMICRMTDARTRLDFFAERALKYFPATNHFPACSRGLLDPGSGDPTSCESRKSFMRLCCSVCARTVEQPANGREEGSEDLPSLSLAPTIRGDG